MSDRVVIPCCGPVQGVIRPPGSKSITNRALVCAALAEGTSTLTGALASEDTRVMLAALAQLGVAIERTDEGKRLVVTGCKGALPARGGDIFVANSGTTMRFLAAMVALSEGRFRLDGVERMRQRPIGPLLKALRDLGVEAHCESPRECPPVVIAANGLPGGVANIGGDISSQYLSGLLMAAPLARNKVELVVDTPLVSVPYVEMTLRVMARFGVDVVHNAYHRFEIMAPQSYRACNYAIEPDASAASYFWAAAAISGGRVTVAGLHLGALQGDTAFCERLAEMGCEVEYGDDQITVSAPRRLRGITTDMNAVSDTVQTLAAVALFAEGPTTIIGVAHIRHKETDRIGDLARELRRLGAKVEELGDGLRITPAPLAATSIETYDDHRMAMSLALVGLRVKGVEITNPRCVDKTYPRFFEDLAVLCQA